MKKLILIVGIILSVNSLAAVGMQDGKPNCEFIHQGSLNQEQVQSFEVAQEQTKVNPESIVRDDI
jgi:hypothetical protein